MVDIGIVVVAFVNFAKLKLTLVILRWRARWESKWRSETGDKQPWLEENKFKASEWSPSLQHLLEAHQRTYINESCSCRVALLSYVVLMKR